MAFIDYYKTLEIDKKATEAEIKKAYRKMARKYHPDLNPNDKEAEAKFKQANEAHEVLSNPEKRKKYDQYGQNWEQPQQQGSRQQQQNHRQQNQNNGSDAQDYSEFFESMFGNTSFGGSARNNRGTAFKGQDFNAELHLELQDVYTTHQRTLTINDQKIRLTIPAGVENGQVIKITGYGGLGTGGGPKGDLYLSFLVQNHTLFKRDKNNLYTTVNLDLYTAILGGEITVPTFDGKVKLTVKPGTQNDTKVKLKGKGFPVYKKEKEFGDFYITYHIPLPTNLTEKETQLFIELAKLRTT
ncbi:DnaJ C-terminal domain-containing protein [Flavobacterium crassostreae]|uniref:Molecular chaperone DnaJ n=1 Tax=Flavobacterium crassostreae TaxID=1763534 RepID=A0A1B9E2K2_9FLAO|nr:J domain-containing protein [Flavobacterium crassostreae]OCB76128.1 molecular chaperone DnaJ [Flavobacterium crassostreae]